MRVGDWVCCTGGSGRRHENGGPSTRLRHFPEQSVGRLEAVAGDTATVWLVGKTGGTWDVPVGETEPVDVLRTGDDYPTKICNICHRLLDTETHFARNQTNKRGVVRRPSCRQCRTDIDKRAPKSSQAKAMEKRRPKPGDAFRCPICDKRSIAGVTAKIVADHNHHTGDIRDFICDSCNTGLGRFKNGRDCLRDAVRYIEERERG